MKKILFTILLAASTAMTALAQVPMFFNYHGVVAEKNSQITAVVTIIDITSDPNLTQTDHVAVYGETHTVSTNANGAFTLMIGAGTRTGSARFSDINFSKGSYGVKIIAGTHTSVFPLASVPYAMVAQSVPGLADATKDIDELKSLFSDYSNLTSTVSSLQSSVSTLVSDNATLTTDVASLKTENSTLRSDNATLKTDVASLKTENSTLKSDITTLKTDVANLKSENSTLKSDNATLKSDVATLKSENTTLNTRVTTLEGNIRTLENRVSSLEAGENPSYLQCPDGNHPHIIDLGLPSGTKWACCNVGANSPEEYGGYYAWGETSEKSEYNWDTYLYGNSQSDCQDFGSDIAGTQYDVAHVKWGRSWIMPSKDQQNELRSKCQRTWTQQNGINGILVTGPNGGQIFLPAAGYREDSGLKGVGSYGYCWSSSSHPDYSSSAYSLGFDAGSWYWSNYYRVNGLSVRAVCP